MSDGTPQAAARLPHPTIELLQRYKAVLAAAWQRRHELAGPSRLADEAAFLPAALELQETPVHPAPRRVLWVLMALITFAIAWAFIGRLDIVAVAEGRIVVSDQTKVIQSLEAAVVRRILVRDGDEVEAGQLLIELDATDAQADSRSVEQQRQAASAEVGRTQALLAAMASNQPPTGTDALLQAEWQDFRTRAARIDAERARREAERVTAENQVDKLVTTLPLARQREADVQGLAQQGFIAGHAGQDRARERIELERDLATARARLREAEAALVETQQSSLALVAELRRGLSDRRSKAELELAQLGTAADKAAQQERLTRLTAPVAGTVQQLAVHTTGGVVTPAQPLLVVVPREADVVAEVFIENKDIGFVQVGQTAEVKLDTFNFTKYGTVPALVTGISADAVVDEQRGTVFKARLQLQRADIVVQDRAVRISPGMLAKAEIRTGDRRVIDYFLGPVRSTMDVSARER
ncbi:MAG: HlyD family type I secretion periplasmic adaptor subunit [Rubrivivax sp.]|nr:HlyD family type I secretion periplasmic adaptor subunit [Rubrivivax sp.]